MTDSLKRFSLSNNKEFQNRCRYYMYQQAKTVLEQVAPDPDDLKLAQAVWSNKVDYNNICLIILTNPTVGAKCDNEEVITETEIEYVISTENKFNTIAQTLVAAGVI